MNVVAEIFSGNALAYHVYFYVEFFKDTSLKRFLFFCFVDSRSLKTEDGEVVKRQVSITGQPDSGNIL